MKESIWQVKHDRINLSFVLVFGPSFGVVIFEMSQLVPGLLFSFQVVECLHEEVRTPINTKPKTTKEICSNNLGSINA